MATMINENIQPRKEIIKIRCPRCKELLVKLYPWGFFPKELEGRPMVYCGKCQNELNKKKEKDLAQLRKLYPADKRLF